MLLAASLGRRGVGLERRTGDAGSVPNTSSDAWDDGPSLLASLWRYRWLVLAGVLLAAVAGYGSSVRKTPQYEAVARLVLSGPGSATSEAGNAPPLDPDRYLRNQALVIGSSPVVLRAAEITGLPAATWRDTLSVQPGKDLDLVVIRVRASNGKDAAKLANAIVRAYQEVRSKRASEEYLAAEARLTTTTDTLKARLSDLDARLQGSGRGDPVLIAQREATASKLKDIVTEGVQASVAASLSENTIQLNEKAVAPTQPVEPRPRRTAAAAALFGLLAASALSWLLNQRRLRTPPPRAPDEASPAASGDLPGEIVLVVGAIPDFVQTGVEGPAPTVTASQSAAAKSYQAIAQQLELAAGRSELRTVLVASAEPGDGKTLTTLNVAIAAGQSGQSVLAVDADLRQRDLSKLCEINNRVGLSDMVHGNRDMTNGQYMWVVAFPGIQVIPGGSHVRDTIGVFTAASFGAILSTIREHVDLVLIDSPALSEGPDALEIAKYVDAAVVVVNPSTPLGVLRATRQRLEFAGVPVLGYVVNGEAWRGQIKPQTNGTNRSSPSAEHELRPATDGGLG
jgi:Mrp family chromosome partitioning ATPase